MQIIFNKNVECKFLLMIYKFQMNIIKVKYLVNINNSKNAS